MLANLTRALRLLEGKGAAQVPELSELVREAQDGAARVRRIVQDLRVFARAADDDVREQVDLRDVVRSSVHLADNEIRHRARLDSRSARSRWSTATRGASVRSSSTCWSTRPRQSPRAPPTATSSA